MLYQPSPTIDLTTLKATVDILIKDMDAILDMMGTEPESAPIDLVEDIVLDALFKHSTELPSNPCVPTKRNRCIHTTRDRDEGCAKKR